MALRETVVRHCVDVSGRIAIVLGVVVALQGVADAEEDLREKAESTLLVASQYFHSISTNGGYAGIYSPDLSERFGEARYEKAAETEIWVQPPGTPSVGEAFLRAYRATGNEVYLEWATDAGRSLAWGQRTVGGWDHRVDVAHLDAEAEKVVRHAGRCTFDDDISQGALRFLMRLDEVVDAAWLDESIALGLDFMLESQFENGAWPQWYPLRGGYHDYYTFNDDAINDCIAVMFEAHERYGKGAYLQSALRGADFIVASQGEPPQAGWAQQYNHDLEPAWARSFEPPGICSAVTADNIRTLVDVYLITRDEKYLAPMPDAIAWLNASTIGEDRWARLYEVGTNRPIYGDREDGNKVHYDYDAISERERTSYGWQGGYGVRGAIAYYERVRSLGATAYLEERDRPVTDAARQRRAEDLRPQVQAIVGSLDEECRWIEGGMIESGVFVRNVNALCAYLENAVVD